MDWLLEQAKTAGPLFAIGAILALGIVWRQWMKSLKEKDEVTRDGINALNAVNKNLEAIIKVISAGKSNGRGRR